MLRLSRKGSFSLNSSFKRSKSACYESLDKENVSPLHAQVFWMSEEDVRSRSMWDWCMAHSSMCPPLHRYYGNATLTDNHLHLQGSDQKTRDPTQKRVDMILYPDQIVEVYRGFDKVFSRWEDRSVGTSFKPVRLRYRDDSGAIHTVYCVFNFHMVTRGDDGKLWFEKLEQWVRELQSTNFMKMAAAFGAQSSCR